jgi:hypothetical protein
MVEDGDAWQARLGAPSQRQQLTLATGHTPGTNAGDQPAGQEPACHERQQRKADQGAGCAGGGIQRCSQRHRAGRQQHRQVGQQAAGPDDKEQGGKDHG